VNQLKRLRKLKTAQMKFMGRTAGYSLLQQVGNEDISEEFI
jgi:hypothetical protein